uniref:Uncharacterized protein n=1 Tax=Mycena chlorophos TaxID=658473 RepID=A0ABQ0LJ13_MYCCL|nr:predicted protein [Mycena chlorophos]
MFLASQASYHSPYTSSNDSPSPVSQPRSSPTSHESGSNSSTSSFLASLPTAASIYPMATSPSRKRARHVVERDTDAALEWECDLSYAVVHPDGSGCETCRVFKTHVNDGKSAASMKTALEDRDKQLDAYFIDGVDEGRRLQRAEDEGRIHELESARMDATALVARLRAEARESGLQFGQSQSQLRLAQAECDALRKRVQELVMALPTERSQQAPQQPSSLQLPQRPGPDVHTPSNSSSSNYHNQNANRMPKSLRQLQLLMSKAHQPGNEDALARVKVLCTEAHNTKREHKSDLQKYLLANWRNPDPSVISLPSTQPPPPLLLGPNHSVAPNRAVAPPPTNPRLDDPTEVWHAYLTLNPSSWPRGVRREPDGSPHFDDLNASRTVARLRPHDNNPTLRNEWMTVAVGLFAAPGMYADLLRREGLVVAPANAAVRRPYRVSDGAAVDMIRAEDVARCFAEAGVTLLEAERELEVWARQYQTAVVYPNNGDGKRSKGGGNNARSRYSNNSNNSNTQSQSQSQSRNKGSNRSHDRDQEERFGWR